jgi:copper(I)-binding protein
MSRGRGAASTILSGSLLLLVAAVLLSLAACSGGTRASPSPAITVSDAWVRISGGPDQPAAGYFTIANHGSAGDALVAASSPGAASVEVHESSMDSSGMVGMQPVARLNCPIGGTVAFAPGGYHLMISGLTRQLQAGDLLELDLVFEHAGTIIVQAAVRQG